MKGVGEPEYYSGADIDFDEEQKCWTMLAKTYSKSVCDQLENLIEIDFKNYGSPLDACDHPEMDYNDILPPDNISVYQMLIVCLKWAATLGRYGVQYATNTLARFGQKPQDSHMKRALRVFVLLKHHMRAKLLFDPTTISHEGIRFKDKDWTNFYPDFE